MNNCLKCKQSTKNLKYCSRSCAAICTNKARGKKYNIKCKECQIEISVSTKNLFCSRKCAFESKIKQTFQNQRVYNPSNLRNYLKLTRGLKCEICTLTTWNNLPIPLEVDHIDGNYLNNTENNLRLICSNCHRQTPTFGAKNKGKGRYERRKRYKEGKSN